jgi:hypothetical protein
VSLSIILAYYLLLRSQLQQPSNTIDALSLVTIIVSLTSAVATITGNLTNWLNRFEAIEDELKLHVEEIEVLAGVFHECGEIMRYTADDLPRSIEMAHRLCQAHQDILARTLYANNLHHGIEKKNLKMSLRKAKITVNENEWKKAFRVYRGSVFMLRDLCAEWVYVLICFISEFL